MGKAKQTPLYTAHKQLGARFTEFGGWIMPVQYSGMIDEHLTVRRAAGLFDLSHMGEIQVRGQLAREFVQRLTTNDVFKLRPGRVQYSLFCNADGGIIDDLLVYREETGFTLVVNAANTAKDFQWMQEVAQTEEFRGRVDIIDVSEATALLAVQGPKSPKILQAAGFAIGGLPYMSFYRHPFPGGDCIVSRTGYTGEIGYEIYLPAEKAMEQWERLLTVGKDMGLVPVGLGARDTLRLEMRYTLYGNDIDETTNPWEAGLDWAVKLEHDFIGREALVKARKAGPRRCLVGLRMIERGIPRSGYHVMDGGRCVGTVTSGSYSPVLKQAIALAYIEPGKATIGERVHIAIRNKAVAAEVVPTPFVPSHVRDEVNTE